MESYNLLNLNVMSMRGICFVLFFICFFTACDFNKAQNKMDGANIKGDTNGEVKEPMEAGSTSITYVPYIKEGLILPSKFKLFDDSYKLVEEITTDSVMSVEIVAKSKEQHLLSPKDEECTKSNFLKIKYKDKIYVVFGKDVYEKIEKECFKVTQKGVGYEIFPVSNFQLKAFVDGLTGCDDESYHVLMIKSLEDNHYSLVKSQGKREPTTVKPYKYAVMLQTMYANEEIHNVSIESDSIVLDVKTYYQIACGSYKLKIVYDRKLSKCKMTDVVVKEID